MSEKSGLLVGKAAISKFLNNASDYQLIKWAKAGMPVRIEPSGSNRGRVWTAHERNLEAFFIKYTRVRANRQGQK